MYSFAQRADTRVVDEPFYAVYLAHTGLNHPGRAEVLKVQSSDAHQVRRQLGEAYDRPVLFIKNMAHHMEVMDQPFIDGAVNIFLIRDPHLILTSYSKVIGRPVMRDIGIEYQFELFMRLSERGEKMIVADSAHILSSPEIVLRKICEACGLEFDPSMLQWPEGPKPYDGIWAPYWYANVHRSQGFDAQISTRRPLPADLDALYQQAKRYYEKLLPFSIKA